MGWEEGGGEREKAPRDVKKLKKNKKSDENKKEHRGGGLQRPAGHG